MNPLKTVEWKDIPETYYQVSSNGDIKNKKTGIIRIPDTNHNGYNRIRIQKGYAYLRIMCHRAVAQAFIPNPLNKPMVDHIDGNIKNNCIENLRWATASENALNTKLRKNKKGSKYKNIVKQNSQYYWKICVNFRIHKSDKFKTELEAFEDLKKNIKNLSEYASVPDALLT